MGGGSLFVRVAIGIVLGFMLLHGIGAMYWGHERMVARAQTFAVSAVHRALSFAELSLHEQQIAQRFADPDFSVEFVDDKPSLALAEWPHNEELIASVRQELLASGVVGAQDIDFGYQINRGRAYFHAAIPTANASWLRVKARANTVRMSGGVAGTLFMSLVGLLILGAVLFATRRVTRHLDGLSQAAAAVGTGRFVELDENRGSREVREASAAFNEMQRRVKTLLEERTQMLAAVSHDLRTIATRLGLRVGFIDNPEQEARAEADLNEMAVILDEALTFARDETSSEPFAFVDVISLIQALVDDNVDLGADVRMTDTQLSDSLPVLRCHVQPVALKRALSNLIDNAVRYGGAAHIVIDASGWIEIRDPGPGMTEAEVSRAKQPFQRLEGSRNRESGGTGLGLSIAYNVLRRHGSELQFANTADGFVVRFRLAPTSVGGAT